MESHQEQLWTKRFIILIICNLLLALNLQMVLSAFPLYVKETFLANDFMVSLVTSLFALTAIVTRLFAGEMLRRGKLPFVMIVGLLASAVATISYPFAGSILFLLVMRVAYGFGFGMASITFPTMASYAVPIRRIGEGMGYFGLSGSLAMALGPMIGLWILADLGFTTLSVISTILLILIFPLLFIMRRIRKVSSRSASLPQESVQASPASQASSDADVTENTQKSGHFFLDKKIWLPCMLNMFLAITYGGLLSFLALFGKEMQLANVGQFYLYNALMIFLVRPVSGRVFDRKGHQAVLIPGALFVMISMLFLAFTTSVGGLIISALLYGAGFGMIQPSIQAWLIKEVAIEKRGMANAVFLSATDLGVAVGSMLLGLVATLYSYSVMYGVSALFMVLFLIAYLLFLWTERMDRKQNSESS
uniref:MFS transporter n=1 Tax=Brevibacillus daliensis TaxID=2892995 RepID=UPI001E621A69|nr:MFS transporter [Brevibacillus daliensis]